MTTITVKNKDSGTFVLTDGEWVCAHDEAYIERACCSTVGSSGYIECGCGGSDAIVCPNYYCTGIEDHEVDGFFDRLETWDEADCYE